MRLFCKDDRWEWWIRGNPAVETAGFKMIDVNRALIVSNKFRTARFFMKTFITVLSTFYFKIVLKLRQHCVLGFLRSKILRGLFFA